MVSPGEYVLERNDFSLLNPMFPKRICSTIWQIRFRGTSCLMKSTGAFPLSVQVYKDGLKPHLQWGKRVFICWCRQVACSKAALWKATTKIPASLNFHLRQHFSSLPLAENYLKLKISLLGAAIFWNLLNILHYTNRCSKARKYQELLLYRKNAVAPDIFLNH